MQPQARTAALTGMGITGVLAMAAALLMPFEGLYHKAYLDPPGIATICWGHTSGVKMGDTATDRECMEYLAADLKEADNAVKRLVRVPLPDGTRAALISFTLNLGQGNLAKSTMLRYINAGNIVAACNQLPRWNKARIRGNLVELPGLTRRREAERRVCLEGLQQ